MQHQLIASECTSRASVARYYDPQTAQFLTRDPLEAMTGSPYGYVDGEPLDGSDPTGLWCLLGHSGSGCRGGDTYNWAVTNLDPVSYALPYYAKEYDAYNSGCDLLTSLKFGAEGAGSLAMAVVGGPKKRAVAGITGYTGEGLNRAIFRDGHGVSPAAMLDAVKTPLSSVRDVARATTKYVGQNASVVLNDAGGVVTTWARNSSGWRY